MNIVGISILWWGHNHILNLHVSSNTQIRREIFRLVIFITILNFVILLLLSLIQIILESDESIGGVLLRVDASTLNVCRCRDTRREGSESPQVNILIILTACLHEQGTSLVHSELPFPDSLHFLATQLRNKIFCHFFPVN